MAIETIKTLYKKTNEFKANAHFKSATLAPIKSAEALIDFVNNNPIRVDEHDDEVVVSTMANDYRKAIFEITSQATSPSDMLAYDCIIHISVNCKNALVASHNVVSEINKSMRFRGTAVAMNATLDAVNGNIFYFASSGRHNRIEDEIQLIAHTFKESTRGAASVSFFRYFAPILGISDQALVSPLNRAQDFLSKNQSVNEERVDNIVSFIGQFTTYVQSYSHAFVYLIEDAMRYACGLETIHSYIENPLITNAIYKDKA